MANDLPMMPLYRVIEIDGDEMVLCLRPIPTDNTKEYQPPVFFVCLNTNKDS